MPLTGTFGAYSYISSSASAVHDARVAGYAVLNDADSHYHAALWNISNLSAITFADIHPSGYDSSTVTGVCGDQAVGYASISGISHALLWTLSGDSPVDVTDLTPAGYDSAEIFATNGIYQVGYAVDASGMHAMRWQGTRESAQDLGLYLPSGWSSAMALAIDENNPIAGIASDTLLVTHAVAWVPEPASLLLLLPAASLLLKRRRMR